MKLHPSAKIKGLSLILCLLMLSPAVISCSENKTENAGETSQSTTNTASTDSGASDTDETKELSPDIPALDFDGASFTFLTSGVNDTNGADWQTYDVWVETLNGEPINDAVYERNEYINETYNVQIAEYKTAKDTLSEIKTEVAASTGIFQAAFTHFQNGASLSQSGNLLDLHSMPYIDLTKPWWDQREAEDLQILGRLYIATGDITVIDNDATWVLFFNKQLREDLQMDDLYTLVREDKWYYDNLYTMIQAASMDTNADGKMSYNDDQFGFITSDASCFGLLYASGLKLVTPDEENIFKITDELEKLSSVVEAAGKIISDANITHLTGSEGSTPDTIRVSFEEGRDLFYGEVMQCATRMRASETDFGLIPWPKFEETQTEYYNWIHSTAGRGVVVPVTVPESQYEMVGAIIEAFSAKSMTTLTEAYYDKSFTYKSLRDEDSIEMLEIVLQSRTYSIGDIFLIPLDSSINTLIRNGSTDISSTWTRSVKMANKVLERAIDNYEKLN